MSASDGVALSVVLRVVGGGRFLRRCVAALVAQRAGQAVEVIVPYDATVAGAEPVRAEFSGVTFVEVAAAPTARRPGSPGTAHALLDRRSAHGLAMARGRVVAIIEDYHIPDPDWSAQLLDAHDRLPHAVIGGCVRHGGHGLASWAGYFLDFGRYQPPFPEGPAEFLTDTNISYKRAALAAVHDRWRDSYNEVTVNWALAARGETLWRRPQMVVRLDRGRRPLRTMAVERFYWGRLFASVRASDLPTFRRVAYALFSPALVAILPARAAGGACRAPGHGGWFLAALPALLVLTAAWSLGECVGYLTGREGRG